MISDMNSESSVLPCKLWRGCHWIV